MAIYFLSIPFGLVKDSKLKKKEESSNMLVDVIEEPIPEKKCIWLTNNAISFLFCFFFFYLFFCNN